MWITGDVSGSETLVDNLDTILASHVNQLRKSMPFLAIVGRDSLCQYYCDGTNDEVQIQAAIDAVSAAGGGVVYIKEGSYSLGNIAYTGSIIPGLPYYSIMVKSKVAVVGAGIGKTILDLPSFVTGTSQRNSVFVNQANGDTDIEISNMTITNPSFLAGAGAYWGGGVCMCGVTRLILRNLRITNASWWLRSDTDEDSYNTTTKEYTTDFNDFLIDNVIVDQHLGSCSLDYAKYGSIRNCKFYGSEDDALIIVGAWQHGDITNCIFDEQNKATAGSATGLIYFANDASVHADFDVISDIKVIGNTLRRMNALTGGGAMAGITFNGCKDIQVIGNLIEENQRGIYDNGGGSAENIDIIGNTIRNNTASHGIGFGPGGTMKRINIVNNRIYNNKTNGIFINGTTAGTYVDGINISDNEIYDDQGVATQTVGITCQVGGAGVIGNNIVIANNNVHDVATKMTVGSYSSGTFTGIIRNNTGFVTEASGIGTINSGATSATITHGLSVTPTLADIIITLGENPTNTPGAIWVDTIGATTFVVNCENDPGASNLDFAWKAIVTKTSW